MWNDQAFKTDCDTIVRRLKLPKQISAIQMATLDGGHGKLGLITQLPSGAVVDICGGGFNERTAKIRYEQRYFFVFLQDLQEAGPFAASA